MRSLLLCAISVACFVSVRADATDILTQHFDNNRSGANLNETTLAPSNVTATTFGMVFQRPVDGLLFAQPLIVDKVPIGGGTNPVVYLVTAMNTAYAYDATNPTVTTPYWTNAFGNPIPIGNVQSGQTDDGYVGTYGTPVIDTNSETMFFVTEQLDTNGTYHVRLRALDITTGAERSGSGQDVTGAVSGVTFNPELEGQRAGLLLQNGRLYIAFASHGDQGAYNGWVFAYDESSLDQLAAFVDTPTGSAGGIWMSGSGIVGDGTNIFLAVGNGDFNANSGGSNYGECYLNMNSNLTVQSWFAPASYANLNTYDIDLGSAGPMLLPGTRTLLGGGKDGKLYLVNADSMGGYNSSVDACTESFLIGPAEIHGGPVYWDGPCGPTIYIWPEEYGCAAYAVSNNVINEVPAWESTVTAPQSSDPGGQLSLSANGSSNGIVWATVPIAGDAGPVNEPGILYAFDACSGSQLWNSAQYPGDNLGYFARDPAPVVANGLVYVATFSDELNVYGQVPTRTLPSPVLPNGVYEFINHNSWLGMDADNHGVTNGTGIQQWGYGGGLNQQWSLVNVTNNLYKIFGVESGLALDVDGDSLSDGALLHLWTALNIPSQLWTITSIGGGFYSVIDSNSGLCVDVTGAAYTNGAVIHQWQYLGNANQQWGIWPADSPAVTNGLYKIVNLNSQKVLDVMNYGTTNGSTVQQYGYGGGSNQQWNVTYLGNGYYSIVGLQSRLALSVSGSSTNSGAAIQVWTNTYIPSQIWQLEVTGGGYYVLINKNSGDALDVPGASTGNGVALQQYYLNWTDAQQWSFQSP